MMKIAVAQRNFTVGDLCGNKNIIIESIQRAQAQNADLVVFAEYAVSGTPCYDLLHDADFLNSCEEIIHEIATYCDNIAAIIGLPIQEQNNVMSGAAFIHDKCVKKYLGKKNVLSKLGETGGKTSNEAEFIRIGESNLAVVIGGIIGTEYAYGERADAVIALVSNPFARGQIEYRYNNLKTLAFTADRPLIYVNHLGGQYDYIYDGTSFVMNNRGKPLAILKSFEEDFIVVDLDNPPPSVEIPKQDRTKNAYNAIKLGLSDFFRKTGFNKACLGMSGGIDSAVVLAVAAEVLHPKSIKVLMLPSRFSSEHSITDSVEMARKLGVEYEILSIEAAFNTVTESLEPILGGTKFDVTEENIQSRLRGLMLMALSNKHGYILLNTSNKSEAAVGYGTLYGDMTGSLGPIADLYKVEVYELARYINRNEEIIPNNIILKAPSAELRPDQKDSDTLPPYEIMDAILTRIIENGNTYDEIISAGFDDATVHRIAELVSRAEFKRRQSPPPLRLSQRPFATHFSLPMFNKFKFDRK